MEKEQSIKILSLVTLVIISSLFVFFRLYKINTSLLFYNDMGRDFNILFDWHQTGKPPLLGPKTSVVPSNQTAYYFYILYPLFVLTGHSAFSSIYTVIIFYLAVFVFGFILLYKKKPSLLRFWLVGWLLIAVHPQFIYQNRYVWNPSFVGPMIALAVIFFCLLKDKFTMFNLAGFCLSISMATAFSYSVAPVLIAFVIYILLFQKRKIVYLLGVIGAFAFSHLPTIFFELRHKFPLTRLMLNRPMLGQREINLVEKVNSLFKLVIHPDISWITVGAFLTIVLIILLEILFAKNNEKTKKEIRKIILFLFLITTALVVFIPFTLHAHFVFGILTLGIFLISLLSIKSLIPVLIISGLIWVQPKRVKKYFSTSRRTVEETVNCAQQVCRRETDRMYLSVEARNHPYHTGPEFRFFFKDAGCQILDIEENQNLSDKMAVVADGAKYNHNQTRYHELDLFGRSNEIKRYDCLPGLRVHILEKK